MCAVARVGRRLFQAAVTGLSRGHDHEYKARGMAIALVSTVTANVMLQSDAAGSCAVRGRGRGDSEDISGGKGYPAWSASPASRGLEATLDEAGKSRTPTAISGSMNSAAASPTRAA
jgi:hypothetical protein